MQPTISMLLVGTPGTEFRLAADMARAGGAQVFLADAPADALALLRADAVSLVMIDVETDVPGFMRQLRAERFAVPVLACGIEASAAAAVAAIRAGARDYVPLPPQADLIAAAILSVAVQPAASMIGDDPALARAAAFGKAVAHARVPVLIIGERGCGKEVMARTIHDASGRPGRFLAVECAGVSPEIVDSELFGHEADAFPDAVARRLGRLDKAAEGTLVLRDIDSLAPASQARLLGALDEHGSRQPQVTARLIATTSVDLESRVAQGSFRADLLARLVLVRVSLPPLRERGSDVALLAAHFAEKLALANALPVRGFSADALALLAGHDWPSNVRELEDLVHRAVLLARDADIGAHDLVLADGTRLASHYPAACGRPQIQALVGQTVETVERELILKTLAHCRGNRTCASGILGISVRTMRNKLKIFIEAGIPVAPAL